MSNSIDLEYTLSPKRLRHSRAVADFAVSLSDRYGLAVDDDELYQAGLHHDLAREWGDEALLRFTIDEQVAVTDEELAHPVLLHAPVAAVVLERAGMIRAQVLAVRHHILGSSEMGVMGRALFCADYLEPNRTYISDEERARLLEEETIASLCLKVVEREWRHLIQTGRSIAHASEAFRRSLKEEVEA